MKMNIFLKNTLLVAACMLFMVGRSVAQVDLAAAAEVMSEVEAMSVSAKAAISEASLSDEDPKEAQARADAIDGAVDLARDAFASMQLNIQNGDIDAAETAQDELAAALVQVRDALMGAIPEAMAESTAGEGEGGEAGDPPGAPEDPPNINEVPWKSQGIKAYYESLYGKWWNASAFGHGRGFGDRDATED